MPNKAPLISIPILTYNGERYLREQLDSIYAQTYKNIEVIAYDDGSTDNTIKILKEYKLTKGLHLYLQKNNVGLIQNTADALQKCTGNYIAIADQDDIWKPNKLERLLDNIQDNTLIFSDSTTIDEDNNILQENYFSQTANLISSSNSLNYIFGSGISAHAMLFKSDLLPFIFPIPQVGIYPDWWIIFVASNNGKIKFLQDSLVLYRRHTTQATKTCIKKPTPFFQRLIIREKRVYEDRAKLLKRLTAFQELESINSHTKDFLTLLIYKLKKFDSCFYNKSLETLLLKHSTELYKVFLMNKKETYKQIKRLSRGIWYYRLKLYT